MIRLLIGGSPCTHWSIAQSKNRETQPSGIGWELFHNYEIAMQKFKPDYFLYENNVSAAAPIKAAIKASLGVDAGTAEYIEINSALVSAQTRKRFYVHNIPNVKQPDDRGILLKDIIDGGKSFLDKAYALTTRCNGAIPADTFKRHRHTMIAEPVMYQIPRGYNCGGIKSGKAPTVTSHSYEQNNFVVEPTTWNEKRIRMLVEKYGYLPQVFNLYNLAEIVDKSPTITAAVANNNTSSDIRIVQSIREVADDMELFAVDGGKIYIKGSAYPVNLPNGLYQIRKLTVAECRKLQTVPEWYQMPCSTTQNFKMLGNGWTVEVIKHILKSIPEIQSGAAVEVLSMYDGMSCGQIALCEIGANIVKYGATEIDKFCIQTTQANFPDTIQLGDAFNVREKSMTF